MGSAVRLLRSASLIVCLIVAASFLLFVVDQTKSASGHQQEKLAQAGPPGTSSSGSSANHEGSIRSTLTEVSNDLTAPFAGLASSSSEWADRGIRLVLALLVYGVGIGYIVRVVQVRV